jgi:hypothetical protein
VVGVDPPELELDVDDFFVTTADHLPHSSVTLPFTCPSPVSPENQYSAFPA